MGGAPRSRGVQWGDVVRNGAGGATGWGAPGAPGVQRCAVPAAGRYRYPRCGGAALTGGASPGAGDPVHLERCPREPRVRLQERGRRAGARPDGTHRPRPRRSPPRSRRRSPARPGNRGPPRAAPSPRSSRTAPWAPPSSRPTRNHTGPAPPAPTAGRHRRLPRHRPRGRSGAQQTLRTRGGCAWRVPGPAPRVSMD